MANQQRVFTPEFNVRVALELISGEKSLTQASREYRIKDSVLSRWMTEFLEQAPSLSMGNMQGEQEIPRRIADLERKVGQSIEDVYMTKRIYSSLGYLTPTEFEANHLSDRVSYEIPLRIP